MKVKAFNIQYDTDGRKVDLPKELFFEIEDIKDAEYILSDLISDKTGYCVFSYTWDIK